MLHGIDHVVILVSDLDAAIAAYSRIGFTVVPGGRHSVATHNALIGFRDGAYIELIAFWEDDRTHRWHRYRASGGGLVDYCMRTDDMEQDVAALRRAGVAMSEKQPMNRLRPDGYRIEWELSIPIETQGMTPFLIKDITPREERVPKRLDHANRVTGISTVTVAVRDPALATRLGPLMGRGTTSEDGLGQHLQYVRGGHGIDFVVPGPGEVADHLEARGSEGGVFALALTTEGPEVSFEPAEAHGARISLVHV